MSTLIFHPLAAEEYRETYSWYEERQPGLGVRFEKDVEAILQKIAAQPETYHLSRKPFREAQLQNFPFSIVYKHIKRRKEIYIVAVYHSSRSPQKKFRK